MARALVWWLVLASIAAAAAAAPLHAQRRDAAGVVPQRASDVAPGRPQPTASQSASTSAWAIAASAILPGAGQAILETNRAFPYLAVEAFAWTSYVEHSMAYRRHRDGYRILAATTARASYSSLRPNGDFAYYERMTHYAETGRYDLVPGGDLDPETDTLTYNGATWLLARRTYWSNPEQPPVAGSVEYDRAVAFYRSRAYDQLYRWSWTGAPTQYATFKGLIRESNDANRRAMLNLGVIIANHVLSSVDSYITIRLRNAPRNGGFGLEASVPFSLGR